MNKGPIKKNEKIAAPKDEKRAKSSNKDEKAKPGKAIVKKSSDKEDGPKVKKPLTAYMLFGKEMRPQIAKDQPEVAPKEVFGVIGKLWKEISEVDKKKFVDMAAKEKEKFEKEGKTGNAYPAKASNAVTKKEAPKKTRKSIQKDDGKSKKSKNTTKKVESEEEDESDD